MARESMVIQGRYAVKEALGQGGFYDVWAADDLKMSRPVRLCVLHPDRATQLQPDFFDLGRAWGRIQSPYVVPILDLEVTEDGRPFMVMPEGPLQGSSVPLSAWIAEPDDPDDLFADDRRMRALGQIIQAVAAAHEAGVVHGELSAAHVTLLRPEERVQVGGFGLATLPGVRQAALLADGARPARAPELGPDGPCTPAADVFALGALCFEALTGFSPLAAESAFGAIDDPERRERYVLDEVSLDLPLELLDLIDRMLASDPEARPPAAEVAEIWLPLVERRRRGPAVTRRRVDPEEGRRGVYLVDAALQDGPITDRPRASLYQQCHAATARILERHPELHRRIESIYFGAMGVFQAASGPITPSHIPNLLRTELGLTGLRGDGYNTYMSTSESGAVALLKACRDLQEGKYSTVLVVAGEAMYSGVAARRVQERADVDYWIRSVVDPAEARYGLSMLPIGDLIMDHIAAISGMPRDLWRDILETVTLNKYQYAFLYPAAMQAAKARVRGRVIGVEDYRSDGFNRFVTPWYRMHDVCPNANGATAVVLTTANTGSGVRLLGMGEGHTKVALTRRAGPPGRPAAVRRALKQLCHGVRVAPDLLWDDRFTAGIFHDAFPAVEVAFLSELAPHATWHWRAERFFTSWSNPLGGLSAAGHALGNSGLFQVAKAFHLLTGDERYLKPDSPPPFNYDANLSSRFYLTSSVGAALTNIVTSLLVDTNDAAAMERLEAARAAYDEAAVERLWHRPTEDPLLNPVLEALGPNEGLVVGRTRGAEEDDIYLIRRAGGATMALHPKAEQLPFGTRVQVIDGAIRRLKPLTGGGARPPEMSATEQAAIRDAIKYWRETKLGMRF